MRFRFPAARGDLETQLVSPRAVSGLTGSQNANPPRSQATHKNQSSIATSAKTRMELSSAPVFATVRAHPVEWRVIATATAAKTGEKGRSQKNTRQSTARVFPNQPSVSRAIAGFWGDAKGLSAMSPLRSSFEVGVRHESGGANHQTRECS